MKRTVPIVAVVWMALSGLALSGLVAGCEPDAGSGDLWDGDRSELAGAWRSRDLEPEGRPYLVLDLSGVYRVVVESATQAIEVDRGSYDLDRGVLVRVSTRNLNPHEVGARTENGIYRVTADELVLDPSHSDGKQLFYTRVAAPPSFRALP